MTPGPKPAENRGGYQVVMPKLGLTITEATLVEWPKADGDPVAKGRFYAQVQDYLHHSDFVRGEA